MPFLKLWVDILDDPDLDGLPDDTCWAWTRMLAVAKRNDPEGQLPPLSRLALILRDPRSDVERWVAELIAAGLIDEIDGTWHMHGWHRWQPAKPLTNAERQERHRQKVKAGAPLSQTLSPREEKIRGEEKSNVTPLLGVTDVTPPPAAVHFELEDDTEPPAPLSRIAEFAQSLMGDSSWAQWADGQIKLGAPEHSVREALEATIGAGKVSRPYAASIMKRLKAEGYPLPSKAPRPKGSGGRPPAPRIVEASVPPTVRDPGPPIKADEALAGLTGRRTKP